MPFAIPMVWREPTNYFSDCYFCLTKASVHSKKSKSKIVHPDCPSALRPVAHASENIPVPSPPSQLELRADEICESTVHFEVLSESSGTDTAQSADDFFSLTPHLLDQSDLNDLVRELVLTKNKSELLASRLKQWNLLQKGVKGTFYRTRHAQLEKYFAAENGVCYRSDIPGLFEQFGFEHDPAEWRLFIDSSKSNLKAVLLHNGYKKPSIPLVYADGLKETYKSIETISQLIKYSENKWSICGDLKVIGLLLGMEMGYTKHQCFLCQWDSWDDSRHYNQKEWPARKEFVPRRFNVQNVPLVDPQMIYLPPLHIKLDLFKNS